MTVNFPASVCVEHFEGCPEVVFAHVYLVVHGGRQELRVIDVTGAVGVGPFENLDQLLLIIESVEPFYQFVDGQRSASVSIQLLE